MAVQMVAPENGSGMTGSGAGWDGNVSYQRSEVTALTPKWDAMRIILAGEQAVKAAGTKFLPMPSMLDTNGVSAQERYKAYKDRAVFYNATRRTMDGLMGQVFSRDPISELPPELETMNEDADGAGVSLNQQTRMALTYVMGFGRAGALVDFPNLDAPATKADVFSGRVRPNVLLFDPWSVINWRTKLIGGKRKLVLVVIAENYVTDDDGFETNYSPQWRVLKLQDDSTYTVEFWRRETPQSQTVFYEKYTPKDGNGKPFDFIPFTFLGCSNNNEYPDEPPMYDLMSVNIGHYRNSADYEESCFMVGQPTPVFAGLTEQWVSKVMKDTVYLGSRGGVMLPVGGTATLLQVSPNSMPFEAMAHKEGQMIALGAKLVTQNSVQKTLGEAQIDESAESSILATAAKNVSLAYSVVLKWACLFVNADVSKIRYSLNTDFPATRLTPNDRVELVLEWQAGLISFSEARANLRKGGIATQDDQVAQAEITANPSPKAVQDQMKLDLAIKEANNAANAAKNPDNQKPSNASGGGNQAST